MFLIDSTMIKLELNILSLSSSRINDKDGLKDVELIFSDDLYLRPELTITQLISNE